MYVTEGFKGRTVLGNWLSEGLLLKGLTKAPFRIGQNGW